ncbi:MAG: MFS transporter [Actinomycetota bacterium]|nr:MFS transporter [Actinomycetota bacterium]
MGTTTQVHVRRPAVSTGLLFGCNGFLFATWVTRIPAIRDQVAASTAELGIALFCLAVGALITMPVSGALCRRWGSAAVCAVCVIWCAVTLPLVALTGSPVWLSLALFALSLGYGTWDVAMNVHGHYVESAARRILMPRFHAAWSAGSLAGAGVGVLAAWVGTAPLLHFTGASASVLAVGLAGTRGFLPAARMASATEGGGRRRTGLTAPLVLIGVLTTCATLGEGASAPLLHFTGASASVLAVGLAGTRGFLPAARTASATYGGGRRRTGLTAPLVLIGLLTTCATLGEGAAADWLALFLVDGRGTSDGLGAAGFTAFTVMMLLGRAAGTDVVERLGRVRALRWAGGVTAVGVALLLLAPNVPLAFTGAMLWGLGISIVFPTAMSAAGDSGNNPESAIAVVSTIGYGGFLIGPPMVGFLASGIGLAGALWLVAAWGAGIVVLAGVTRTQHRPVTG